MFALINKLIYKDEIYTHHIFLNYIYARRKTFRSSDFHLYDINKFANSSLSIIIINEIISHRFYADHRISRLGETNKLEAVRNY